MERLLSCEFNMDTACVEVKFADDSMIAINTIDAENEIADNMYQRSDLDWLIYNKPLEYAQLVLGGDLERYVKGTPEHLVHADPQSQELNSSFISDSSSEIASATLTA